jgi:hypothetical protein
LRLLIKQPELNRDRSAMPTEPAPIDWNLSLTYRMVRERYNALTHRQRSLQGEQEIHTKRLAELRGEIDKLAEAIAVVERAGGDASRLRTQIGIAHAERKRIEPRHVYLADATMILAENLRLLGQAHDALHWLLFTNDELRRFDQLPEVLLAAVTV